MANTYELIASTTVGSGGTATITFSSIPSTYTDLLIRYSTRIDVGGQDVILLSLNGSTSSFTMKWLYGSGSAIGSVTTPTRTVGIMGESGFTANTFSSGDIYIPNYTASINKNASADGVSENNATTAVSGLISTIWSNTAAITQIDISPNGGNNFVQYSTFYLYGIKNS